jgi:hypothetical protein
MTKRVDPKNERLIQQLKISQCRSPHCQEEEKYKIITVSSEKASHETQYPFVILKNYRTRIANQHLHLYDLNLLKDVYKENPC